MLPFAVAAQSRRKFLRRSVLGLAHRRQLSADY